MSGWFGAAAAAADGIFGIAGQMIANDQNTSLADRQANWNLHMQQQQQAYNERMWDRMNEYNHPQAQMARFKAAGLNPHLIYGKGTPGNTTPLKAPDIKPYNRAEAKNVFEGFNAFGDYINFKNIDAQTDNTKAQTDVAKAQAQGVAIENYLKMLDGRSRAIDLGWKEEVAFSEQLNATLEQVRKTQAETEGKSLQNKLLDETMDDQKSLIKAQAENAFKQGEILDFKNQLRKYGVTDTDNYVFRMAAKMLHEGDITIKQFVDGIKELSGGLNIINQFMK